MQTDKSLGALGVFAGLAGLVIFIFFVYNLYLIATGVTTNENFKWEEVGEMIHARQIIEITEVDEAGVPNGSTRYEQRDRRHPSHPYSVLAQQKQQQQQQQQPQQPQQPQQQQQPPQQQQQPQAPHNVPSSGQENHKPRQRVRETVITKLRDLNNIYDEGVKENIKTILWPPSLDPSPSAQRRNGRKSIYERVQKSRKGA
jgi:hypothetical protein